MVAKKIFVAFSCALLSCAIIMVVLSAQAPKAGASELAKSSTPPLVPSLSELSELKAVYFKLRVQLTQCQSTNNELNNQLASRSLTNDQATLELLFRSELKCGKTDKFNWNTLKCETDVKKN